jgi:magnesium transporter
MQIKEKTIGALTWIDVLNPEQAFLEKTLNDRHIDSAIIDTLMSPLPRSQAEVMSNCIYLALHFPLKKDSMLIHGEVDFLIQEHFILTIHYTEIPFLEDYIENLETNTPHRRGIKAVHGGAYFAYFIDAFYKHIEKELDAMAIEISQIEKEIFSGNERKTIEDISVTRRRLFDFESAIRFHKEVLESFASAGMSLFGREYATYGDMIVNNYFHLWNTIEHQKNMLLDLKDTNDFLISNKTNELIKSFTVISYIILPLTLVSGFFGMNVVFPTTISQHPYGPLFMLVLMACFGILIAFYLNTKKWL